MDKSELYRLKTFRNQCFFMITQNQTVRLRIAQSTKLHRSTQITENFINDIFRRFGVFLSVISLKALHNMVVSYTEPGTHAHTLVDFFIEFFSAVQREKRNFCKKSFFFKDRSCPS